MDYPIDKRQWCPSLIPGPIVLVSTYNTNQEPNIAPKSWLQMVSFDPPILMLAGTKSYTTEQNILDTQCFGLNFVDSSLASRVYDSIKWYGQERLKQTRFTLVEASKIHAPLVAECRAHLECQLHSSQEVGSGFIIFGEIVHASIWEDILQIEPQKRYELLDQIIFLEEKLFAKITSVSKIES